jgi:sterol desaturase/sphingolipid hydroxylase (fatty acid hydroxylase superfamily)
MDTLGKLLSYLTFPLYYVTQPNSQYFGLTYLGAGLCAIVLYLVINRRSRLSFRAAVQLVLPPRLVEHQSTKLDFKLFFLGTYYLLLQAVMIGGFSYLTVPRTVAALNRIFGETTPTYAPSFTITAVTMLLVFLAIEFGYWLSHFMMHKIPALWEFHKVHHSAEVLTPLTEWRQHPLELALFPILMGGAACLVQGPMVWFFGEEAQIVNPMAQNYISMAFWYTILHLRHSELPFYATGTLGKIIQAPAHHQVHHSTNPKHFDKNLGYCLSIFDWAFGTLYVPKKGEKFKFGLGHKDTALETALGSMLAPVGRAGKLIFGLLQKQET